MVKCCKNNIKCKTKVGEYSNSDWAYIGFSLPFTRSALRHNTGMVNQFQY